MSDDWLRGAGAANHQSFFAGEAGKAGGFVQSRYDGVLACWAGGGLIVAFPHVPEDEASAFADEVVGFARQHLPVDQRRVGWWALDETALAVVGPRLLARGFDWAWRPNWMALHVADLVEDAPVSAELVIRATGERFEAAIDGRRVGSVSWHVCDHDGQPVGGIYDTNVEEPFRRQGIGTALTVIACQQLRQDSCQHVLLNATPMGQPVYQRAGFRLLGEAGQTWWMMPDRIEGDPPSSHEIEFVEGIGTGDLDSARHALDQANRDLDAPLVCGLSPLGVAAITKQPASARWLVSQGATLDIISAWDLGWRDEAVELLARRPALADRQTGPWATTPLHTAAQRGDVELARAVLAAGPDLGIRDTNFGADALGWARHLGQTEIAALIEQAAQAKD